MSAQNLVPRMLSLGTVAMAAAVLFLTTASAQPPRPDRQPAEPPDRSRDEDDEPTRGREGGIPRQMIEPGDDEEGMDEGVPQLRRAPDPGPGRVQPYILPPQTDWKLGVYAYNTETGVVVTRVIPGTPATRIGLEPGDRIVAVGGYQVGFVGDYLYPLGHELQRQAGRRGQVLLLLQNVRNGRLLVTDVRLERGGVRDPVRPFAEPAPDRQRDRERDRRD